MSGKYNCILRAIEKRLLIGKYRNELSRLRQPHTAVVTSGQQRMLAPSRHLILLLRLFRGPWFLCSGLLVEYRIVQRFFFHFSRSWYFPPNYDKFTDIDIGRTAGVTGQQRMRINCFVSGYFTGHWLWW